MQQQLNHEHESYQKQEDTRTAQHHTQNVPSSNIMIDKCKYTIIPIQNADHRQKLQKFVTARGKVTNKSSLCRFYLRGICIMKPQYCKFAHSIKQLNLGTGDGLFYMTLSEKQRKKREFVQKKQFNQTALFILKNVPYCVLQQYQHSQRYKLSKLPVHSLENIGKDRSVRIRIRQILHRQCWDGFIDFLQKQFPSTNYPISFISFWYANFGFDKPQTRSKFGDFLKYAVFVRKYVQVDVLFPPSSISSIFLVNTMKKQTILQQNIEQIYQICMTEKEKQGKQKMQWFLQKALPQQLSKKYICRYFMAGNCQQSSQKCLYAHSIGQLQKKYQLGQQFPVEYRQPVVPIEVRMNFVSLYDSTRKYPQYCDYTLQDIGLNSTIRNQLRQKVHFQLFRDFMNYLQQTLPKCATIPGTNYTPFTLAIKDLQRYYHGAGFNHTNQNKFQHFQSSLWNLGYYMEDIIEKDVQTLQKKKITMIYKIPPIKYLDHVYQKIIRECVHMEIKSMSENGTLLQSALRRTIYSYNSKQQILPLHVYLRYKNASFQDAVLQFCQKQETDRIFFQSGQQNLKKISQLVKKYVKKNKSYLVKIETLQHHIREQKKNQINLNHLFNLRGVIQAILLDMGKLIYFFPFDNNSYMTDLNLLPSYTKNIVQKMQKQQNQDQIYQEFVKNCTQEQREDWIKRRIVLVDGQKQLQYAKKYLRNCSKVGVDLEGRLRVGGYVDLVQVSAVKRNINKQIVHKQIFIFDIFGMKNKQNGTNQNVVIESHQFKHNNNQKHQKIQSQLYIDSITLLKLIFESPKVVKILHDCRQDSIALKNILKINIKNVFDTSGFDVYLVQKQLYEEHDKNTNNQNLLKKIYEVKVSGLNTILDTYKAPNGVNIWKQSMKKRFGELGNRSYFQQRPIEEQFLEYSARDVEDLVQVYEYMIQQDYYKMASFIGDLYSSC